LDVRLARCGCREPGFCGGKIGGGVMPTLTPAVGRVIYRLRCVNDGRCKLMRGFEGGCLGVEPSLRDSAPDARRVDA